MTFEWFTKTFSKNTQTLDTHMLVAFLLGTIVSAVSVPLHAIVSFYTIPLSRGSVSLNCVISF